MARSKREGSKDFSASAYALVPDPESPDTWSIRIEETPGVVTPSSLDAAMVEAEALATEADRTAAISKIVETRSRVLGFQEAILSDADATLAIEPPSSINYADNLARRSKPYDNYSFQSTLDETLKAIYLLPVAERTAALTKAIADHAAALIAHYTQPRILETLVRGNEHYDLEENFGFGESIYEAETPQGPKTFATLIKAGPNKSSTRLYTPEFLQTCISEGRFTNSLMFLNHPRRSEMQDRPERDLGQVAAVTGEAYWDDNTQSVKAPIEFLGLDVAGSPGQLVRSLFRNTALREHAGTSIFYSGPVQFKEVDSPAGNGKKIAVPLRCGDGRKFSIDFVTAPGAGGAVEQIAEADAPPKSEGQEGSGNMDLQELTLEQLKQDRPDLVQELQSETPPTPTTEDATVHEADFAPALKGQIAALTEAIAELSAKVEGIETRPLIEAMIAEAHLTDGSKEMLRADFTGRNFETPEALKEAFDARVEALGKLEKSIGGQRIADLGSGDGLTEEDGTPKTAAEILREAGLLPGEDSKEEK